MQVIAPILPQSSKGKPINLENFQNLVGRLGFYAIRCPSENVDEVPQLIALTAKPLQPVLTIKKKNIVL